MVNDTPIVVDTKNDELTVSAGSTPTTSINSALQEVISNLRRTCNNCPWDDINVMELLQKRKAVASDDFVKRQTKAIGLLEFALVNVFKNEHFRVLPLGSYALGTLTPNSDLDLVCMGNLERKDFFEFAHRVLNGTQGVQIIRLVDEEDAIVPLLQLSALDVTVELQYCRILSPVDRWFNPDAISDRDRKKMDIKSLTSLSGYTDAQTVLKVVPNANKFREVYGAIREWAKGMTMWDCCWLCCCCCCSCCCCSFHTSSFTHPPHSQKSFL